MVEVRESRQQKMGSVEQTTAKIVGTSCKIVTSQNCGRKSVLVMSGATDHHTKEVSAEEEEGYIDDKDHERPRKNGNANG